MRNQSLRSDRPSSHRPSGIFHCWYSIRRYKAHNNCPKVSKRLFIQIQAYLSIFHREHIFSQLVCSNQHIIGKCVSSEHRLAAGPLIVGLGGVCHAFQVLKSSRLAPVSWANLSQSVLLIVMTSTDLATGKRGLASRPCQSCLAPHKHRCIHLIPSL